MEREVEIGRLGAQGDGMAQGSEGPLFVPFALPGERVRVALDPGNEQAQLLAVLEASPDRIAPICPHFGICGGCALQHLEEGAYLAWKRDQVRAALQSRRLDTEVDPVRSFVGKPPPGELRPCARAIGNRARLPQGREP